MLSLSADISEASVNLQMINGDESATQGDVAHAKVLMNFAESLARGDEKALEQARTALLKEAGAEVLVDAAAVAGNFQRMVRIADSTGIPLDDRSAAISMDIREELELGRFGTAQHTPQASWKLRLISKVARPLAKRMLKRMERKAARTT